MGNLISRQDALDILDEFSMVAYDLEHGAYERARKAMCDLPSKQPGEWLENYVSAILQAGLEGREVSFKVGDRTFAVRELNYER